MLNPIRVTLSTIAASAPARRGVACRARGQHAREENLLRLEPLLDSEDAVLSAPDQLR